MERLVKVMSFASIFGAILVMTGCGSKSAEFGEDNAVNTPLYADNRAYFLEPEVKESSSQRLIALGEAVPSGVKSVSRNAPLSIVMRSVDLPAALKAGNGSREVIKGPADYAVILDVGAASDGSSKSIVVWYQRGVQPDQSLNFSNLLIYYEPQWDERVAPLFRIRVMDVSKEKNAQTRKSLERANNVAGSLGAMASNPAVAPLIGVAFTAAELVFANANNRLILDYTVQLYSQSAVDSAIGGGLGVLRSGSYVVVGRPASTGREFWETDQLKYQVRSRRLLNASQTLDVPTALITVGTFKSVIPTSVMQRSAALTILLSENGASASTEQLEEAVDRLSGSVKALAMSERLEKYRRSEDARLIIGLLTDPEASKALGADNEYNLLESLNSCYEREVPFGSGKDAADYYRSLADKSCKVKS